MTRRQRRGLVAEEVMRRQRDGRWRGALRRERRFLVSAAPTMATARFPVVEYEEDLNGVHLRAVDLALYNGSLRQQSLDVFVPAHAQNSPVLDPVAPPVQSHGVADVAIIVVVRLTANTDRVATQRPRRRQQRRRWRWRRRRRR